MPIYEFKCLNCKKYFEIILQNKNNIFELKCLYCNSKDIEKIISNVASAIVNSNNNKKNMASKNTRSCSEGSCTTYNIMGPK